MASLIDTEYFRGKAAASQTTSGRGGSSMDETQKRLGALEVVVAEIKAVLPHLATKADLADLRSVIQTQFGEFKAAIQAQLGDTKASTQTQFGEMKTATQAQFGEMKAATQTQFGDMNAAIQAQFGEMKAATQAQFGQMNAAVQAQFGEMKASTQAQFGEMKAAIANLHAAMIKWFVATIIGCTAAAYSVARLFG